MQRSPARPNPIAAAIVQMIRREGRVGVVGLEALDGSPIIDIKIAAAEGYFSQMPRYYGAQIRGGGSAVKLGLDADSLSQPRDTLDIMVCFDWEKYLEVRQEPAQVPDTLVLYLRTLRAGAGRLTRRRSQRPPG